jgi:DNA-binding HxlR family transcriptional regulator
MKTNKLSNEKIKKDISSPIQTALDIFGGKWKLEILYNLIDKKAKRFKEIERLITGISPKMLIKELKDLEENQIVSRTQFPTIPPTVEYQLTAKGHKVIPVIEALVDFEANISQKQKIEKMMSED